MIVDATSAIRGVCGRTTDLYSAAVTDGLQHNGVDDEQAPMPARRHSGSAVAAAAPAALAWVVAVSLPLVAGAWWPIAASQGLLDEHATTFADDWISFAPLHGSWVLQPWIPALLQRAAWELGGFVALSVLAALLWVAITIVLMRIGRAAGAGTTPTMVATIAMFPLLWPLILQPQTYAVLIAALLVLALWRGRWWFAPVLVVFWANVHGSVPAGALLCAAAAAGAATPSIPRSLVRVRTRAVWLVACFAAMFASPLGVELIPYVRDIFSVDAIAELTPAWQGRDLFSAGAMWIALLLLLAIRGLLESTAGQPTTPRALRAALLVLLALAALSTQRHSVWFAVVALPLVALELDAFARRSRSTTPVRGRRVLRAACAVGLLALVALSLPGTSTQQRLSRFGLPPRTITTHVSAHDEVYAPIRSADYLHVKTGARVFVDARLERFDSATLDDYLALDDGDLGILEPSDGSGRRLLLIDRADQETLDRATRDRPCTRRIAADDDFALYEVDAPCD
ncbi:MAG: hypothetical protein KDC46_07250 [Thermoleophilia bacterium]|nr:hypothetical protein [Thermoleophilia bacterium]